MPVTKREEVTKQGFCKILGRTLRLRGSLLLVLIRLFEAGRLLTFSTFRMGAYSRWALIRGWALIRINTVCTRNLSVIYTEYAATTPKEKLLL